MLLRIWIIEYVLLSSLVSGALFDRESLWSGPFKYFNNEGKVKSFWDYELMPMAYYGFGAKINDAHPLKVAEVVHEEGLGQTLLDFLKHNIQRAPSQGWHTRLQFLLQRADKFPAMTLAFVESQQRAISMLLTSQKPPEAQPVVNNEVQWDLFKDSVHVNFGPDPLPFGDAAGLLEGTKPLVLDAFDDYVRDVMSRTPARHVGATSRLLKGLLTETQGVLNMRRDLLCLQLKVMNVPKTSQKIYTQRYHNVVFPVILGQVLFLDPSTVSNRARMHDETLTIPIIAGASKWGLASYQPTALLEPEVDAGRANRVAPARSAIGDYRGKAEGSDVESVIRTRRKNAPDFLCPQATVLTATGYSEHCVHLGQYSSHAMESVGPEQQFALRCGGMYPVGSVFVGRHHKQIRKATNDGRMHSEVVSIPVIRLCLETGWTEEVAMTEADGEATLDMCHRYLDRDSSITANDLVNSAGGMVRAGTRERSKSGVSPKPADAFVLGPES